MIAPALLLPMLLGATAPVKGMCWIADVERAGADAVRLLFDPDGPASVSVGDRAWTPRDGAAGIELRLGDRVTATGGVHDRCVISVERRGGRIGVVASAVLTLPNLPPDHRTAFYPAR